MRIWIQEVKPMRIQAVRLLRHKKFNFYMKNIINVGNRSKNIHTKVQKPVNQVYL